MPPSPDELARSAAGRVVARPGAARARWAFADLPTADGHGATAAFAASLRLADSEGDRRVFAEQFLADREIATAADVRDHLAAALRAAAEPVAAGLTAEAFLTDAGRAALRDALATAARAAAFAVGVEVLAPLDVETDSPGLRRSREDARADAERSARLRRAADTAAEFRALRENAPDLDPGALLERLDPADRPAVYAAAAGESTDSAGLVYAVSGSLLLQLDPADPDAAPRLIDLPPALGPARSVRPDGTGRLLIGGRNGVAWLDPADPAAAVLYAMPNAGSDLGFNAAVHAGDFLWATHSALGLVAWRIDQPANPPQQRTAPHDATPPRLAAPLAGRDLRAPRPAGGAAKWIIARRDVDGRLDQSALAAASGEGLFALGPDRSLLPIPLPDADDGDPIIGLIPDRAGNLAVARRDGGLLLLDRDLNVAARRHHPGPLAAACGLPWAGSTRLLLATETGGLEAVGLHDSLVTAYHSPHRGLRALAADARTVAAVSPDRQRLLLWPAAGGRATAREIHVASLTRHRAADVAVG